MNATVFHFQESWSELSKRLPEELTNLAVADLKPDVDTSQKYIKLRVVLKWPVVREKETPVLLKILAVAEESGTNSKRIPIFFLGKLSEACQTIREKDILVLSNFNTERNRQPADDKHSCQINLDVFKNTYIWIATEPSGGSGLNIHRRRSIRTTDDAVAGTSTNLEDQPVAGVSDNGGQTSNVTRVVSGAQGSPQKGGADGNTRMDVRSPVRNAANPPGPSGSPSGGTVNAGASTSTAGVVAGAVQRRQNLTLQAGKGARDYVYTSLKNIRANTLINVYGVVKFFKPIARTRGTDYYMVMSITDPSLEETDSTFAKLKCILFSRDAQALPQISNIGDIVRLHRLSISTYQGQLQGQRGPGFSCVVFEGTKGGSLTPISSTKTYTLIDDDLEQVEKLRDWGEESDLLMDTQDMHTVNYDTFADLQPGKYYNVVCQVVAISEVNTDVHFLFKCWDGTPCQHSVYEVDIETLNSEAFLREDKDLMATSTGYRLDVSVFDDHCEAAANVSVGDFVKFVNLHAMIHKDPNTGSAHGTVPMLELCLHRGNHYGRKMVVLPSNDPAAKQLGAKLELLRQEREKVQAELAEKRKQWRLEQEQAGVRDNTSAPLQSGTENNASTVTSEQRTLDNANNVTSHAPTAEPVPSTSGYRARKRSIHEIANAQEAEKMEENRLLSLRSDRETRSSPRKAMGRSNVELSSEVRSSPRKATGRSNVELSSEVRSSPRKTGQSSVRQSPRKTPQVRKESEVISPSPTPKPKRSRISMLRTSFRNANKSQSDESLIERSPKALIESNPNVPQCMQTTATVLADHHHIDPVTVAHILDKSLEKASKFRLKARVVNYYPKATAVEDFLHLHCEKCKYLSDWQKTTPSVQTVDGIPYFPCPECPRSSPRKKFIKRDMLQYTIAVKLLLEDDTGSIVAQIWKENAHAFFDGVTAEDLLKKKRLFNRVMKELEGLCKSSSDSTNEDQTSSSPIIDCCIMSYSTAAGVCFQIFDTVLTSDLH